MTLDKYQLLPPLTPDERASLVESIRAFSVLQPVIVDEEGNVLDGHHRAAIADELGIDYPTKVLSGLTEEQKIETALVLNLGRRHLDAEQKQALVASLRERGLSVRWISERTGIPKSTVGRLTSGVPNGTPERVTGRDGKSYAAAAKPASTIEDPSLAELEQTIESGLADLAVVRDAASELVRRIKAADEETWSLILDAYERRAWSALGYPLWDDYCTREFGHLGELPSQQVIAVEVLRRGAERWESDLDAALKRANLAAEHGNVETARAHLAEAALIVGTMEAARSRIATTPSVLDARLAEMEARN